jgi:hypothetical protein
MDANQFGSPGRMLATQGEERASDVGINRIRPVARIVRYKAIAAASPKSPDQASDRDDGQVE